MVFLIFFGATCFSYVFRALGGDDVMIATLASFGIDTKWEILIFLMVLVFLLGFPFEWIEICLIVLPIFAPILLKFDFSDHLGDKAFLMPWFGTLVAVNLQTSFMTPPFGFDAVLHEGHRAARRHHGATSTAACTRSWPCSSSACCSASGTPRSSCGCRRSPACSTSLIYSRGDGHHATGQGVTAVAGSTTKIEFILLRTES